MTSRHIGVKKYQLCKSILVCYYIKLLSLPGSQRTQECGEKTLQKYIVRAWERLKTDVKRGHGIVTGVLKRGDFSVIFGPF